VLAAVLEQGRSLDRALQTLPPDARIRAAVMDLSYGVLRRLGLLDFLLGQLLDRPLTDPDIRYLLLVGLYELLAGRTPPYAAVNEAVSAAPRRAAGLVNAVLRNFLRRRDALLQSAQTDPVARWNHPAWWIARLKQEYPDDWQAILDAANRHPPMTLRVNRRRVGVQDYRERLSQLGLAAEQIGECALTLEQPVPVSELPGFDEGLVSVQDLGAQYAAALLDCRDGMRVLDACAAPGGKTTHLLERHSLDLTALDLAPERLQRVRENLERLGLTARLMAADAAAPSDWWDGRPYDRILLDAPCTASGVVRRHPDGKWLKRADDATALALRQGQMLEALWPLLRPGGKLLYATCSLFGAENRGVVRTFLEHHPEAAEEPLDLAGGRHGQLLPDSHHDGFFYARLVKT
jgi:16S rRNA (cytosine967-C5)-methyltransferase